MEIYDVLIIGGGPAGLTAGIYCARYKLKTKIIAKDFGLAAQAHKVCNFPSYPEINGLELMQKFTEHINSLNIPIVYEEVKKIEKRDNFYVITEDNEYIAGKIIFAAGTEKRKLNVSGENKFLGRGVSYCAACDGTFFKNKVVGIVGGSNSALTAALLLSEYSSKVYIIYRKDNFFRAEPVWTELVKKNNKIECLFNEEIEEIIGDNVVESIKLKSGKELEIDGVFIEIGSIPNLEMIKSLKIETDNEYIKTDKEQKTNIYGFFAAGDITNNPLKQIITAAGQGAIAAYGVYTEITKEN